MASVELFWEIRHWTTGPMFSCDGSPIEWQHLELLPTGAGIWATTRWLDGGIGAVMVSDWCKRTVRNPWSFLWRCLSWLWEAGALLGNVCWQPPSSGAMADQEECCYLQGQSKEEGWTWSGSTSFPFLVNCAKWSVGLWVPLTPSLCKMGSAVIELNVHINGM